MKLIIQIPCFNEELTLPKTVADLPRKIDGIDRVEILVIDDGSRDRTFEVAQELGVHHIVRHTSNKGLAAAFRTGLEACLALGADIIVNTDADNQYVGQDIPKLIQPIMEKRADIVIGDRETAEIEGFSAVKKTLQRLGSAWVRRLSATRVPDAVSGFRALSRQAAMQINIISTFSYTTEMLIQAGRKRMAVCAVPIGVNPQTRRSRLFRSIPQFITLSAGTMVRTYTLYKPLRVFTGIGLSFLLLGGVPIARFLFFYFAGDGSGHVQSLILGSVLLMIGFMTLLIGVLADLVSSNRQLIEMLLEKMRRLEHAKLRERGEIDDLEAGPKEKS